MVLSGSLFFNVGAKPCFRPSVGRLRGIAPTIETPRRNALNMPLGIFIAMHGSRYFFNDFLGVTRMSDYSVELKRLQDETQKLRRSL